MWNFAAGRSTRQLDKVETHATDLGTGVTDRQIRPGLERGQELRATAAYKKSGPSM